MAAVIAHGRSGWASSMLNSYEGISTAIFPPVTDRKIDSRQIPLDRFGWPVVLAQQCPGLDPRPRWDSWQQRWLTSGADAAAGEWTAQFDVVGLQRSAKGRAQLTGAAGRLLVPGAIRPSYLRLYKLVSAAVFERFRCAHDPDGFAALDLLCDATERFTATDRQFAYCQLTRILTRNGGRLADITVEDCIQAYRAQTWLQRPAAQLLVRVAAPRGDPARGQPLTVWAASRRGQLNARIFVNQGAPLTILEVLGIVSPRTNLLGCTGGNSQARVQPLLLLEIRP
jgi:hypothetical protein